VSGKRAVAALLCTAVAVVAAAQAAPQPAPGAPWYEHYRRGLELEQAGAWEPAIGEFRAAAAVERAPKKRIRTSGQNFLFNYDPHFHLARCLTEVGRYREAGMHLGFAIRAGVTPREQLAPIERRLGDVRETFAAPTPPAVGRLVVESSPPGARVVVGQDLIALPAFIVASSSESDVIGIQTVNVGPGIPAVTWKTAHGSEMFAFL